MNVNDIIAELAQMLEVSEEKIREAIQRTPTLDTELQLRSFALFVRQVLGKSDPPPLGVSVSEIIETDERLR